MRKEEEKKLKHFVAGRLDLLPLEKEISLHASETHVETCCYLPKLQYHPHNPNWYWIFLKHRANFYANRSSAHIDFRKGKYGKSEYKTHHHHAMQIFLTLLRDNKKSISLSRVCVSEGWEIIFQLIIFGQSSFKKLKISHIVLKFSLKISPLMARRYDEDFPSSIQNTP